MAFSRLFMFTLISVVILLIIKFHTVSAQDTCTTLRGAPGDCVPLQKCKIIVKLLQSAPRPLPPRVSEIVRRAHCGTINNVHHVCCDSYDVSEDDKPTSTPRPQQSSDEPGPTVRKSVEVSESDIENGMDILQHTFCGKSDADKVSNGENASLSEYPWMALLVYTDGVEKSLDCGGSLITDKYVLTAAHCVRGGKKLTSVRLGEHDTTKPIDCVGKGSSKKCAPEPQEIDIEEIIYHHEFRPIPRFSNDIALIRLKTAAVINKSVKPICLPITERSRTYPLDRMIISGWGKIENGTPATILQKAVVPLRDNSYCDEKLKVIKLSATQLCAGGGDKRIDTCLGDSGGPIFYSVPYRRAPRYVQFGVVSGGSSKCGLEFPSIFTRVESFLDWIAGNLSN